MTTVSQNGMFSLLPARQAPWKQFVLSLGTQGLAVFLLAWVGVLHLEVLAPLVHDYHFMQLVSTPPPVNHEPAPLKVLRKLPVVAREETPALRLPAESKPKPREEPSAPKVDLASNQPLPSLSVAPVIPRQLVRTDVFSTGSSATPTLARAPQQVQTGGFGDPNGVPARDNKGKPVTIAQLGSFDLPSGPGQGNGSGGARGARGVVASAGFGNGIATGDGSGRISASRGTIRQSGFGDAEPAQQPRPKPVQTAAAKLLPAEILFKPNPVYTEEARKLRIEGEVLLQVVFEASGRLRVVQVVRGLGHGLDEAGMRAAEQIRFKPALQEGRPVDSVAVLHIIFQLA